MLRGMGGGTRYATAGAGLHGRDALRIGRAVPTDPTCHTLFREEKRATGRCLTPRRSIWSASSNLAGFFHSELVLDAEGGWFGSAKEVGSPNGPFARFCMWETSLFRYVPVFRTGIMASPA